MERRTFLIGSGALALSACSSAEPFDTGEVRAAFPPVGAFVEVEGLPVHYWERGDGPPVVLVHGAAGNLRDWTFDVGPRLAEEFRVIAFDRPGFGYSGRPDLLGYDPRVQARILRKASAKLGAKRPVVVGHSWGGALAMAWATEAPESIAGAVPVSGVTIPYGGLVRVFYAIGLGEVATDLYSDYLLSSAREGGGIERFLGRVFRPQSIPAGYLEHVGAPLALRESTLRANSEDLAHLNAALIEMAPKYPGLRMPIEAVHGDADFIDWDDHALPLVEQTPSANLALLPGVGHMAHHAAPDEIGAAVDRVLTRA
ncbi:MAG: alpha/beta fold hydrolase [Paracoccaceae bacterium]